MWNNFLCKKEVVLLSTLSNQVMEECKSSLWLEMPDNSNWQPIPFTFLRICGVQAISLFSSCQFQSTLKGLCWAWWCVVQVTWLVEFLQIWVILLLFLKWKSNFRMIYRTVSQWRMVHFTCRVHRNRKAERERRKSLENLLMTTYFLGSETIFILGCPLP